MREWHIAIGHEERGPIPEDELLARFRAGDVPMNALVWSAPMPDWMPAGEVPPFSNLRGIVPPPLTAGAPAAHGYAGFWKRFGAFLVDFLITAFIGFVLGFFVGIYFVMTHGEFTLADQERMAPFFNIAGFIIGWLYYAGFESSALQATPGKMALGICVTDLQGRRVSFLRATGRQLGKILCVLTLFVGYVMIGFTEKKQGLHDILARCLVVNRG